MYRFFSRLFRSFRCASHGFVTIIKLEQNARIHGVATIIVLALGSWFSLTKLEWTWVFLSITLVWSAELINTAIEILCDMVQPEQHPEIKKIKDLSAAAVLMLSVFALVVALSIFIPYILKAMNI